ncbi:unnamed protein product [Didymodactylos carnosus]|uniref:Uncharacterized protein n=1 Tax=Didymodactylos carnosus TaxID=1234261 RepID=A0A814IH41_9BILA|nr:unnamed protein product [Didymodactylos carnosus]CAF3795572.1 unnamed protein product [Didymodactylos carnosus]
MRFHCQCLNVEIEVLDKSECTDDSSRLIPNEKNLIEAPRSNQQYWLCNVNAYPVHIDDKQADRACLDKNYSTIAKVILSEDREFNSSNNVSFFSDNVQRECEIAQNLYRESMEAAEREKEERIRVFQIEQEALFQASQETLLKEKDNFLRILRLSSYSSPKTSPTSFGSNQSFRYGIDRKTSYEDPNEIDSDFFESSQDGVDYAAQHAKLNSEKSADMLLEDDIDDNLYDSVDFQLLDIFFILASSKNFVSNFATSLPREIHPELYSRGQGFPIAQTNDKDKDDLERIGKSFRDLSQSMATDGTELFGALPSPRLNTKYT